MKRMWKPVSGAVFAVLAIFGLLALIKGLQIGKMMAAGNMGMPPTTVTSAEVKQDNWPKIFSAVGSVSAVQGAMISTELGGVVAEVKFENGGMAKKGDVLVRLDTSAEEAQLHSAEADLELARADLLRTRDLAARKVVSKQELDGAESKFKQKEASVNQMRSMISKKEARAPFDGQLGIREVNVGQSIDARRPIVQLTALDPVFVDFALPQQYLAELKEGLEVRMRTDAIPGREFKGTLHAINPMVDASTRNVSLQATLPNSDHALRPGMFAKVDVILPRKDPVLTIPTTAIAYAPYGDSVFVIETKKDPKTGKDSQVIRQQFIRIGEARGDFVVVLQGLKPGEKVASSGVFKLRNGMPVVVNNELAPKAELHPSPAQT
ncbi:MAG TPA: efflux RND transporter periplasmic adaptor subunit [Chthoniobacterales bacterium]|nr:efflux RND transporter periplasmic adaptor subunit [Chthoniobacterales bacterium]